MSTLEIEPLDEGPRPAFLLAGSLDVATRVRLLEVLRPGLRDQWADLILDLTWVRDIDAAGVTALVELASTARGSVTIRGASGLVRDTIEAHDARIEASNLLIEGAPAKAKQGRATTDAGVTLRGFTRRLAAGRGSVPAMLRLGTHGGRELTPQTPRSAEQTGP